MALLLLRLSKQNFIGAKEQQSARNEIQRFKVSDTMVIITAALGAVTKLWCASLPESIAIIIEGRELQLQLPRQLQ